MQNNFQRCGIQCRIVLHVVVCTIKILMKTIYSTLNPTNSESIFLLGQLDKEIEIHWGIIQWLLVSILMEKWRSKMMWDCPFKYILFQDFDNNMMYKIWFLCKEWWMLVFDIKKQMSKTLHLMKLWFQARANADSDHFLRLCKMQIYPIGSDLRYLHLSPAFAYKYSLSTSNVNQW